MKKIARMLLSATTALSLLIVPVVVHAQEASPIVVDTGTPAPLPSTGPVETTPTTPDSGIAPPNMKLMQNAAVFAGGSILGAGIGFGLITLRKRQTAE